MPAPIDELPTVIRRMQAGRMLLDGASLDEVANALHLSLGTVRKYRAMVREGGLEALKQLGVGGRSPALDAAAMEWIASALRGSAREHGFASDAWTSKRLCDLIHARYDIRFSRVYVWRLATNLGLGSRLSKSSR
jgi:transposase